MLWLVEHLPESSAFVASVKGGPKFRPWTLDNQLLAAAVNLLFVANRQRARKPARSLPVKPPQPERARQRRRRVVRVASMPGSRPVQN